MGLLSFAAGIEDRKVRAAQAREQEFAAENRAARLKPILSQFGAETGEELGNLLTSGNQGLVDRGESQLQGLLDQRQGIEAPPEGGTIGNPSPKDFTTSSLGNFMQTGDPNELVRYVDPLQLRRANQSDDRLALSQLMAARPAPAQIEQIMADQISLDTLDSVVQQSDPSFFGNGFELVADARKEVARRFGGESEQQFLDFWREYENWIIEIRKDKFGSQFTPNEEKVFNRLIAKPSDQHTTGMRNIQQQREMVNRARMRRNSVLEEFGFNVPQPSIRTPEVIDRTTQ